MSDDGMSMATIQHRNGYGIDEPYSRNVNKPERTGTSMSNVTRMTKMTQKTAVTKVAMQPYIQKVTKRDSNNNFDANSKLGGISQATRKYHSTLRGNVRKEGSEFSGNTTQIHGLNATIGYQNGFKLYGKNAKETRMDNKITLDDDATLPDIHQSKLDKQQSEANFGQ